MHARLGGHRFLRAQGRFPERALAFPLRRQRFGQAVQARARGTHVFQFRKQGGAFARRQLRGDEGCLPCGPRRKMARDDPRPQFQRADTLAATPGRSVQMAADAQRPSRREIRFRGREGWLVAHTLNLDLGRVHIVACQFCGQHFTLELPHVLVQLVFKLFQLGHALGPLLAMRLDKLSQALQSRALQKWLLVAHFHGVASV